MIRAYPRQVLIAMGARVAENIMYQMVVTFSITYLAFTIGATTTEILVLILGAHAIHFLVVPLYGRLAGHLGPQTGVPAGIHAGHRVGVCRLSVAVHRKRSCSSSSASRSASWSTA